MHLAGQTAHLVMMNANHQPAKYERIGEIVKDEYHP